MDLKKQSLLQKHKIDRTEKLKWLKDKKLLFGLNLANDFTATVKLFHKYEIHADILLRKTSSAIAFNLTNPLWEDKNFPKKHISIWNSQKRKLKSWLFGLEMGRSYFFNHLNYNFPGRVARKYDLVFVSTFGNEYFYKHQRLILYDAGGIRSLFRSKLINMRMITKAYKNADIVIYTNPDTEILFQSLGITKLEFMPLPGNFTKYIPKPKGTKNEQPFTVFMPSRQNWRVKASHHLIHAFAKASASIDMKLIITEWGVDLERTKALVKQLKLKNKVKYVKLVNKDKLISRINEADVVADHFGYGTYPSSSIEAMACGKPVLVYINEVANKKHFGAVPPVVNCQSIKSIEEKIIELYSDRKKRDDLGRKARKWIKEKHNPRDIFERQTDIIYNYLNNKGDM